MYISCLLSSLYLLCVDMTTLEDALFGSINTVEMVGKAYLVGLVMNKNVLEF